MRLTVLNCRALSRNVRLICAPAQQASSRASFHARSRGSAQVETVLHRAFDVQPGEDSQVKTTTDGQGPQGDHRPPDQRTLKLGKTVRTLHERLPTLLASPLPQEILSPDISLLLFPSTHPHLPTVSGRIPYTGALWTAPVAWGRLPLLGNVKLDILSERMVRNGGSSVGQDCRDEKLIVKWKTCGKTKERAGSLYRGIGATEQLDRLMRLLGGDSADEEFCGLFIFEFDDKGRILRHTIEHAEEGGNYDRMTKMVSVTDWLLGKAPWRRKDDVVPGLAFCDQRGVRRVQVPRDQATEGR